MGVASTFLAALLTLDVGLQSDIATSAAGVGTLLTVHIKKRKIRHSSELTTDDSTVQQPVENELRLKESTPAELTEFQQAGTKSDSVNPPIDAGPVRDWSALTATFAKQSVDERFRQEDVRASMWQQSRSVMFQPDDDFKVNELVPILADFNFREPVGILGLGFTIGSCFIGIPLLGVPVEERSVGITLVICRNSSG
jgi:hypothetical protein